MAMESDQQQLVHFLERRVWNPILKAEPSDYAESVRKRLERVQRKTVTQRERYRNYQHAGESPRSFRTTSHS